MTFRNSKLLLSMAFAASLFYAAPATKADVRAKPTIVLVHGAFADGSSWDKVAPHLATKGFNVVAVHEPLTSFEDDVAATKRAIDLQTGDVILVGHSYGGAVITEAGNSNKVVRLVYVAAFAPDTGESINDLGRGHPVPRWTSTLKIDSGGFAWLPEQTIATEFAQDLTASETRLLTSKQGPIFARNFDAKIASAAWRAKPVTYVRCTEDHMIDAAAQLAMAGRMNALVFSLHSSHVPMLSKPKDVAAAILAVIPSSATASK